MIRELLTVLDDPNAIWRDVHTHRLVGIVENTVSDEIAGTIDSELSKKYLAQRRQNAIDRKQIFRDELEQVLPKMARQLEALTDFGFEKAMVEDKDGNRTLDPALISEKDAKVAMQAMSLMLKSLGMLTTKVSVDDGKGSVFDL